MRTRMILLDLGGPLLPMDMDVFTGYYFQLLVKKATPHGNFDQLKDHLRALSREGET